MIQPRLIPRLRDIANDYDLILCDVWGVIHNGVHAFAPACEALSNFRAKGGSVVLITNAPRPSTSVAAQVVQLGVPDSAYDAIVSSGDVTRGTVLAHRGEPFFHLGPSRDLPIFAGLNADFAAIEAAHFIVCTGLFNDETEVPDDYRALLDQALQRGLEMVCANPDIVAERGTQLIYCAGSLADMYRAMGGKVVFAGKPYAPIYEQAVALGEQARTQSTGKSRILAIGDSVRTDLEGANAFGIDCLFVSAGIHAAEFGARERPDLEALASVLGKATSMPRGVAPLLAW